MEIKELYKIYCEHPDITTDSRSIKKGQLFFALKGPTFNGNEYAIKALEAGAAYSIVDEELNISDSRIIKTKNVLETLQALAKHHREQFTIPFIAITGSNGKTTTKELVAKLLSTSFKTIATSGNLNNHIGVPLTILKIPFNTEMAIIEMGANHQHEIESYCSYALPSHGLITNCGKAHLEGFGGVEGVIKGKGELFKFLEANHGLAFVNNYDTAIINLSNSINDKYTYGPSGNVEGKAEIEKSFLTVEITSGNKMYIRTSLVGEYNLPNVLAAVAIGRFFKIADDKIKEAIEGYMPTNSRSQLINKNGNGIILDAYNANPSSMKVAIENFAGIKSDRKILMLGSMMELGEENAAEHEAILKQIEKNHWDKVILVGDNFNALPHHYIRLNNSSEAREWFINQKIQGAYILIKGSRSMQMEKILD